MSAQADILDQHESLRTPFLVSIAFHAAIIAGVGLWAASSWSFEEWGNQDVAFGNAVSVTAVRALPVYENPGRLNPVANDTQNQTQQLPKEAPVKHVREPENAIPLKRTHTKPAHEDTAVQKYRPEPVRPNQVYSHEAPAAVSPMFAKAGTAAGVGVDQNSLFGSRYGAYAQLLMERVAQHWNTGGLQGVRAPYVMVGLTIFRNGTIQNPHVTQSSNNYLFDTSALRAVMAAAPFPPLPAEYSGASVNLEFRFVLQR